jgi:hypothetical protein
MSSAGADDLMAKKGDQTRKKGTVEMKDREREYN